MPLSVIQAKSRLQDWMLRTFPAEQIHNFNNQEFIDHCNQIAQDLNAKIDLHQERYYNKTVAGETNYELQGKILKIFYFGYETAAYLDQYYSFVEDVIVLKELPEGIIQLDIRYLRDIEKVALDADEIDLPDHILSDFIDMLKIRLKVDFNVLPEDAYKAALSSWSISQTQKLHTLPLKTGTFRHWATDDLDDERYDITDHYVSADSVYADVAGDYHFIPDA